MHVLFSHLIRFLCLAALISPTIRCAPSPKYLGSGAGRRRAPARPSVTARKAPRIDLRFSAPLKGYSESRITSRFGLRRDPRYNREEFHSGIDIKARLGDKVFAAAAGTVTFSGRQQGFGKVIIIDHGERISTVYGHLSRCAVQVGARVDGGDVIGIVGRTGNATGIHLHFEIRKADTALDPLDYL